MGVGPNTNRAVPDLRISDFLMSDPETNTMYEVEVTLGRVDETYIIRSITDVAPRPAIGRTAR